MRAAAARLVSALTEPFLCQFSQLASQAKGERSTMFPGRRLFTHTEAGRARIRMTSVGGISSQLRLTVMTVGQRTRACSIGAARREACLERSAAGRDRRWLRVDARLNAL